LFFFILVLYRSFVCLFTKLLASFFSCNLLPLFLLIFFHFLFTSPLSTPFRISSLQSPFPYPMSMTSCHKEATKPGPKWSLCVYFVLVLDFVTSEWLLLLVYLDICTSLTLLCCWLLCSEIDKLALVIFKTQHKLAMQWVWDCDCMYVCRYYCDYCDTYLTHDSVFNYLLFIDYTRSSAMADGLRDALVSIEKLAIDEWPWHTPKVITVAAIEWLHGISLPVCGLLFQRLYLGPFSRHHNVTACNLENSFIFDNEA